MRGLLIFALAALPVAGQNDSNGHLWANYFGDHAFGTSKWGVHLEGQWRRTRLGTAWQQLLLRPGVNYQVHPKVLLTAGYGFIQTHRYGEFPARAAFPEHRIFEQAQIAQRGWKLDWSHRLRLEQRFIGQMGPRGDGTFFRELWRHENRFRYMLRTNVPLHAKGDWYLGLYDEVFLNFGKNVGENGFDQNRAYVAVGRKLPGQTRFEIGFMEQTLQQRNGRIWEHNHTLMVSIFSRAPFGR